MFAFIVSYISSSSEDLGEDHSSQTISAVVQCGDSKLQHGILVLHRAQIQQAAKIEQLSEDALYNIS